jgi:hypothetical protein
LKRKEGKVRNDKKFFEKLKNLRASYLAVEGKYPPCVSKIYRQKKYGMGFHTIGTTGRKIFHYLTNGGYERDILLRTPHLHPDPEFDAGDFPNDLTDEKKTKGEIWSSGKKYQTSNIKSVISVELGTKREKS